MHSTKDSILGAGIVLLSQLNPKHCIKPRIDSHDSIDPRYRILPFYHTSKDCKEKKEKLETRFENLCCEPWLYDNRITAEILPEQWSAKSIEKYIILPDGNKYPKFKFEDNAVIFILDGVSRVEVAKSSMAKGCKDTFGDEDVKSRWWVVNFRRAGKSIFPISSHWFLNRNCYDPNITSPVEESFPEPPHSMDQHVALPNFLQGLTKDQLKDAGLSRKIVPMDAFEPLIHLRQLWELPCPGMWADIRRTKCKEVSQLSLYPCSHNRQYSSRRLPT
jgi:hypothetical protein